MKTTAITKMLIISAFLGVLCGVGIDVFIRVLRFVSNFIWDDILPHAQHHSLGVIAITVAGGILMGVCVKYFGTNPGVGFEAVLVSAKKDGELGFKQIKRVVLNSFAGLATGASIGPENPITVIGGYIGNVLGKKLKLAQQQVMGMVMIAVGGSLGIIMNTPIAGPILLTEKRVSKDDNTNLLLIFASMVAASVGFGVYLLLKAPLLTQDKLVPTYSGFQFIHLLYALIIGILGTGIGFALKIMITKLKQKLSVLDNHPISRGALAGLFIGICGVAFPLVLFDGSAQLSELVSNTAKYSALMLITLAVVRLISTAVALSSGYQGGNIFPSIFVAGATGLAIHSIFTFIPAPVAMMACMVPAMYVFVPLPLFTLFLFTEISSFSLLPVMSIALVSAYVIMSKAKATTANS